MPHSIILDGTLPVMMKRPKRTALTGREAPPPHRRTLLAPRGLLVAALLAAACGRDSTGPPEPAPVAGVVVQPDSASLPIGGTLQLSATLRDASGTVLSGRMVTWSTSAAALASVSTAGLVQAHAAGRVVITATSEGRAGSAVVQVDATPGDFAVVGARFTQGVQSGGGSIPMVLGGNAAVLNVLIAASPPRTAQMQVVLRLLDAATQSVVHTDTALVAGPLHRDPDYGAPSAQFLVPASLLRSGLAWQVERDPRGLVPDDSVTNDVFPRMGFAPLATLDVPTLRVRFVPIVLSAHGNATGAVSDDNVAEYLRTLRSIFPIGRIEARIGSPLTSAASFGVPPSGGQQPFWTQVLGELDLARLADAKEPDAHWYGVVRPPNGFNFTEYGGFAYIPATGSSTGARTRSAVGVQVGWFNNPTQARDLVAHELGHNFGRLHAPCGGAGSPLDGAYPVAGGTLEGPGHDVFSWATQQATRAATVSASTGDVMGYCFPVWSSVYTYLGVLGFRAPFAQAAAVTRVLVVRGSVLAGEGVELEPAFTFTARPSLPERRGDYRLEGRAADGRLLFSYLFEPARLDHAPELRPFTLALPISPETEEALATLRVSGPAGEAVRVRSGLLAGPPRPVATQPAAVSPAPLGMAFVSCASEAARGVLVQHSSTGALLGTANAPSLLLAAPSGTPLAISCSDGVQTVRWEAEAP